MTNLADTMDAIDLGADYLGFNFYPDSKRYLPPDQCAKILEDVPFNIPKVGIFVNADPQLVIDIATELDLDLLQFHGDESHEYCQQFARPYMKALRPKNESDLAGFENFGGEFFLIDAFVQNAYGGTGVTSNWDLAKIVSKKYKLFLSGGLTTQNIELAIQAVKPYAVDVCSSIEQKPGVKDYAKMEEFIKRAKGSKVT